MHVLSKLKKKKAPKGWKNFFPPNFRLRQVSLTVIVQKRASELLQVHIAKKKKEVGMTLQLNSNFAH